MMDSKTNGSLGPLAMEVADIIQRYSTLAEDILMTQCRIFGLSPITLDPEELLTLIPLLKKEVERIASPMEAARLEADLNSLLKERSRPQETNAARPNFALRKQGIDPNSGSVADKVLKVLGEYTPFAKQIFNAQCKSIGLNPTNIGLEDLDVLIPKVSERVGQWTSPQKGKAVECQLQELRSPSDTGNTEDDASPL